MGTKLTSSGICTDRTLPMLNPLWTPVLLPGSKVWYDADLSAATLGGDGGVLTLKDLISGVMATATSGAGPSLVANSLNGHSAFGFSSKTLTIPAQPTAAVPRLVWSIFNSTVAPSTTQTQTVMGNAQGQMDYSVNGTGLPRYSSAASSVSGDSILSAAPTLLIAYADGTTSTSQRLRVNGVVSSKTGTPSTLDWTAPLIMGYGSPLLGATMGAFGLAMGTQALLDVQKLEGYLAQRFFAANFLPSGHPYRSVAPRRLT